MNAKIGKLFCLITVLGLAAKVNAQIRPTNPGPVAPDPRVAAPAPAPSGTGTSPKPKVVGSVAGSVMFGVKAGKEVYDGGKLMERHHAETMSEFDRINKTMEIHQREIINLLKRGRITHARAEQLLRDTQEAAHYSHVGNGTAGRAQQKLDALRTWARAMLRATPIPPDVIKQDR